MLICLAKFALRLADLDEVRNCLNTGEAHQRHAPRETSSKTTGSTPHLFFPRSDSNGAGHVLGPSELPVPASKLHVDLLAILNEAVLVKLCSVEQHFNHIDETFASWKRRRISRPAMDLRLTIPPTVI